MPPLADEHFTVMPGDRTSRFRQQDAAAARARDLCRETGIEHDHVWDRDGSRYVVRAVAFAAPVEPWDDETNYPERRHPDWTRSPTRFVPLADFLTEAAGLAGRQWLGSHETHPAPAQFVRDLQAAFDLQYGRGHFWVSRHGHRVSVQCRYPVSTTSA